MKEKIKKYAKKFVLGAITLGVIVIVILWTSDKLVSWHYNEFTAPFLGQMGR